MAFFRKHLISTQKFQAPRNDFGVKPCAVKPPSIQRVCPVVNEETGMHRNAITPVISWVSATRLSGIQSSRSATNCGLLNICHNKFTDLTKIHGDYLIRRIQTFTQTGWKEKPITQFILAHHFHSLSGEIHNTMQG